MGSHHVGVYHLLHRNDLVTAKQSRYQLDLVRAFGPAPQGSGSGPYLTPTLPFLVETVSYVTTFREGVFVAHPPAENVGVLMLLGYLHLPALPRMVQ